MKPICSICTGSLLGRSEYFQDQDPPRQEIPLTDLEHVVYNNNTGNIQPSGSFNLPDLNPVYRINATATPFPTSAPDQNSRNVKFPPVTIKRIPTSLSGICAPKCGHVFHEICLEKWWERQRLRDFAKKKPSTSSKKASCPLCSRLFSKSELIRIFLDGHGQLPRRPLRVDAATQTEPEAVTKTIERKSETSGAELSPSIQIHSTLVYQYDELTAQHLALKEKFAYMQTTIQSIQQNIAGALTEINRDLCNASHPSDRGRGGLEPELKLTPTPKRTIRQMFSDAHSADHNSDDPLIKRIKQENKRLIKKF